MYVNMERAIIIFYRIPELQTGYKKARYFLLILLCFLCLLSTNGQIILSNYDITLNCNSSGTPTSVAWNPNNHCYYIAVGGNTYNSIMVFDSIGTLLQSKSWNWNALGIWWNSELNRIETNSYNTGGAAYFTLLGDTIASISGIYSGMSQPAVNSCGSVLLNDSTDNGIWYYYSGKLYKYQHNGSSIGNWPLTLPANAGNMNSTSIITPYNDNGIAGDWGIYDYSNRKVYMYDGQPYYKQTYVLPGNSPQSSQFGFAYANEHIWLSDGQKFYGYPVNVAQSINFETLPVKTYGDSVFTISANGGGGSGNPITFTSSNNALATCIGINGSSIKILNAGIVTIFANQAGNGSYKPAPQKSQVIIVNKRNITVTVDSVKSADSVTYKITSGSFVNKDTLSGTVSISKNKLGKYTIQIGTLTAGPNYNITLFSTEYIVSQPTSIDDITTGSLVVYPNPASTNLKIKAEQPIKRVYILNQLGQVVFSANVNETFFDIDISGLKSGIYFVRVYSQNKMTSKKVMVVR